MNCGLCGSDREWIDAASDAAKSDLEALRIKGTPVTLVMAEPRSINLVRDASYNARNVLHVFEKAANTPWSVPYLATAAKCGIQSTVTICALSAGQTDCPQLLEHIAALSVNYRMRFHFALPEDDIAAYGAKLRLYMECTQYEWEICPSECCTCRKWTREGTAE